MRKFIAVAIMLLSALSMFADVTLGFPGEESAMVGIYIKDINKDSVIAENASSKALMTASVMKAVTAASALSTLDTDFKYTTNVYLTGNIADGVCYGDLIVVGSGDPTIESSMFPDHPTLTSSILKALAEKGIKSIKGKVIVEDKMIDPGCIPRWEIDDVPWAYGAGLYGFNYRDNAYNLWPVSGISSPHVPDLDITLHYAPSGDLQRGIFSNNLHVYGPGINNQNWNFETSMNCPADVYQYELTEKIRSAGISVNSEKIESNARNLLVQYQSPTLYDIMNQMLVYSHNLYAEALLRLLQPNSTRDAAINHELALWKSRGMKIDYIRICDGSGLSRSDRLSPEFIGEILCWMAKSMYSKTFLEILPTVGYEGTVVNFLKNTKLQGKMALKTGSMQGVQCYAGYKIGADGKPSHVVVILVNTFFCDRQLLRSKIEHFLLKTFD